MNFALYGKNLGDPADAFGMTFTEQYPEARTQVLGMLDELEKDRRPLVGAHPILNHDAFDDGRLPHVSDMHGCLEATTYCRRVEEYAYVCLEIEARREVGGTGSDHHATPDGRGGHVVDKVTKSECGTLTGPNYAARHLVPVDRVDAHLMEVSVLGRAHQHLLADPYHTLVEETADDDADPGHIESLVNLKNEWQVGNVQENKFELIVCSRRTWNSGVSSISLSRSVLVLQAGRTFRKHLSRSSPSLVTHDTMNMGTMHSVTIVLATVIASSLDLILTGT